MQPLPSYDLATIADRLRNVSPEVSALQGDARAAVAVILRERTAGGDAEVFFIERASREGDPWSGHTAFPGGRHEASDPDLLATALRETREEVSIDLARDATLLARLPDVRAVLRSRDIRMTVAPFVFALRRDVTPTPNVEVAATLWAPLASIARGETRGVHPYDLQGAVIEFPCHRVEGRVVWGLTYQMLHAMLAALHA